MQTQTLAYTDRLKHRVKEVVAGLLTPQTAGREARTAFAFHFCQNPRSLAFQRYYRDTVSDRDGFLSTPDFFRRFKQEYALQGITGAYLDELEGEIENILNLIDRDNLADLYFGYFAEARLLHKGEAVTRNLGSFFSKLVHTFAPQQYSALDSPIKKWLGLGNESFYIAFIVASHAFREWANENSGQMRQIRQELDRHKTGREFSAKMTNLKLLDLIFWRRANVAA